MSLYQAANNQYNPRINAKYDSELRTNYPTLLRDKPTREISNRTIAEESKFKSQLYYSLRDMGLDADNLTKILSPPSSSSSSSYGVVVPESGVILTEIMKEASKTPSSYPTATPGTPLRPIISLEEFAPKVARILKDNFSSEEYEIIKEKLVTDVTDDEMSRENFAILIKFIEQKPNYFINQFKLLMEQKRLSDEIEKKRKEYDMPNLSEEEKTEKWEEYQKVLAKYDINLLKKKMFEFTSLADIMRKLSYEEETRLKEIEAKKEKKKNIKLQQWQIDAKKNMDQLEKQQKQPSTIQHLSDYSNFIIEQRKNDVNIVEIKYKTTGITPIWIKYDDNIVKSFQEFLDSLRYYSTTRIKELADIDDVYNLVRKMREYFDDYIDFKENEVEGFLEIKRNEKKKNDNKQPLEDIFNNSIQLLDMILEKLKNTKMEIGELYQEFDESVLFPKFTELKKEEKTQKILSQQERQRQQQEQEQSLLQNIELQKELQKENERQALLLLEKERQALLLTKQQRLLTESKKTTKIGVKGKRTLIYVVQNDDSFKYTNFIADINEKLANDGLVLMKYRADKFDEAAFSETDTFKICPNVLYFIGSTTSRIDEGLEYDRYIKFNDSILDNTNKMGELKICLIRSASAPNIILEIPETTTTNDYGIYCQLVYNPSTIKLINEDKVNEKSLNKLKVVCDTANLPKAKKRVAPVKVVIKATDAEVANWEY